VSDSEDEYVSVSSDMGEKEWYDGRVEDDDFGFVVMHYFDLCELFNSFNNKSPMRKWLYLPIINNRYFDKCILFLHTKYDMNASPSKVERRSPTAKPTLFIDSSQ
jgi:hypothetical protein